jgi:hypothetical protein
VGGHFVPVAAATPTPEIDRHLASSFGALLSLDRRKKICFKILLSTGTISPDQICLELAWFNKPRLGHVTLDSYFNFQRVFKALL